jgi:hypothetical protein
LAPSTSRARVGKGKNSPPFGARPGQSALGLLNVIPYNPRRNSPWPAPAEPDVEAFVARMNGETIFTFDYRNGTSANPYVVFFARIEETSAFEFVWTHEDGTIFTSEGEIRVS